MTHPDDRAASGRTIRSFGWQDYPATARLWQATGLDVMAEDELRGALEHGPDLLLVADDGAADVVGVVLGTFDGRRGWIHRLAVHPENRRIGLATSLVGELEQRLATRGTRRINLLVMPDNFAGLRFWQRLGYISCPDVLCTKPMPA